MRTQRLRPEEEWARLIIAGVLEADVELHDDGTQTAMYDLHVRFENGTTAAVEVTAAADPEAIELWKLVNPPDERWIDDRLAGGWMAELQSTARAKALRSELPLLLRALEAQGIMELEGRQHRASTTERHAHRLGVHYLSQNGTDFPGSIYATIQIPAERSGGMVAADGNAIPDWLGPWLRNERADVISKLAAARADVRHVFVLVPGFSTAHSGSSTY